MSERTPVAWIQPDHLQKARVAPFLCRVEPTRRMADFVPLYTRPAPLTDEQIEEIAGDLWRSGLIEKPLRSESRAFARAIEAALWGESPKSLALDKPE